MVSDDEIKQFKEDVRGREVNSEQTLDDYARWIRRFEGWWDGGTPTETALRRFDQYLCDEEEFPWKTTRPIESGGRETTYAFQTRVKALSALKLWCRVYYNTVIENEPQNMALGEAEEFNPDLLSVEEVQGVVDEAPEACPADDCQVALQLGYDAIMRCAEVAQASVEDLDLSNGIIHVVGKKGSMAADIGLSTVTVTMLQDHVSRLNGRRRLFHNSYDNPWNPTSLSWHFIQYHHPVGFHSFSRHSPIAHRLQRGEPLGEVSRRARHANISTTVQYGRIVGTEVPSWAEQRSSE